MIIVISIVLIMIMINVSRHYAGPDGPDLAGALRRRGDEHREAF